MEKRCIEEGGERPKYRIAENCGHINEDGKLNGFLPRLKISEVWL